MKQSKNFLIRYLENIIIKYAPVTVIRIFLFIRTFNKFKKAINRKKNFSLFSDNNLNKINNFEYKISSQNNEDGVIDYIFKKVPNNKTFCEIGVEYSEFNCLNLIKQGWSGQLIDANKIETLALETNLSFFFPKAKVQITNTLVTINNINSLVYNKNKLIDFFSLDIDGNDYWILKNLNLKPIKVICCEYNHWLGKTNKTMKYIEKFEFSDNGIFGASLSAINELLNLKGFFLIGVESSGTNAFFINEEYKKKFEIITPENCFKSVGRFYSNEKKNNIYQNIKKSNLIDNI